MEKSSIKLVSNIMLKSKFEKDHRAYLPFDMLSRESHDSRLSGRLSKFQQEQKMKRMFMASKIVQDDSDDAKCLESDDK